MSKSSIHESVASVLKTVGVKSKGSAISPANNRGLLREDASGVIETGTFAVVKMLSHPKLSGCSWDAKNITEAKVSALAACRKAGGFPIFESEKDGVLTVRFTREEAKATVKDEKTIREAKSETEDDETDGTGEPSGDTTTNTKAKNDKGVGTKKGTKADNKGDENSEECNEAETASKPLVNKEKLGKYKELVKKRKELADKAAKDKSVWDDVKEEIAAIDAELDQISESFYDGLKHGVTFVLYPEGKAEIHGLTEEEIAPFGGTAPAVPVKYAKQAKLAGPNSKVDMGVLSIYKTEGMSKESA